MKRETTPNTFRRSKNLATLSTYTILTGRCDQAIQRNQERHYLENLRLFGPSQSGFRQRFRTADRQYEHVERAYRQYHRGKLRRHLGNASGR
ncbi:unnamed protein product [Nesidiocoris tenuis]|uniref:Uncharacterized protein n=1 Tax=Nesidiocoris tenuis TaxID=355587 RepID=A0A6H5GUA7_9HEMI|nr:unnamed protein product [Nesidiocoris tenuis]